MKFRFWICSGLLTAFVFTAVAQEDLSPRALFYRASSGSQPAAQTPPPPPRPARARPPKPEPPEAQNAAVIRASAPQQPTLGLRYNLLLVDAASGKAEPVATDRTFRSGECIAVQVEANESGYLYILHQGSSGNWQPLLPSPDMPAQRNQIQARRSVRVPEEHCFRFDERPGSEKMFLVLTRQSEQLNDLNRAIRGTGTPASPQAPQPESPQVLMAANKLNSEVNVLRADLQSRDLKIQRVAEPMSSAEPAHSVYVVNASLKHAATAGVSSGNRVVAEIVLKHQ